MWRLVGTKQEERVGAADRGAVRRQPHRLGQLTLGVRHLAEPPAHGRIVIADPWVARRGLQRLLKDALGAAMVARGVERLGEIAEQVGIVLVCSERLPVETHALSGIREAEGAGYGAILLPFAEA